MTGASLIRLARDTAVFFPPGNVFKAPFFLSPFIDLDLHPSSLFHRTGRLYTVNSSPFPHLHLLASFRELVPVLVLTRHARHP